MNNNTDNNLLHLLLENADYFSLFHCYLMTWHKHEEPLFPSLPTFNISRHFERKNFIILKVFSPAI